ncbi:EAL domain-containing protein [Undibacterium danionis]|uniref:EAL domain-containing protein n=1 Tax=Undibacterium danionis TaxID=1812100 RepID=A0ABV6IEJ3_9BURK
MTYAGLHHYLEGLQTQSGSKLFSGTDGRVTARFFNARLSSVFQPIRSSDNLNLLGHEAFVRTFSVNDQGLSILKLLEHATTDDESVELDRLCRLLHVINFFRQTSTENCDLYLNVHKRLLTAVAGNHGAAFHRVLKTLDIPQKHIVLQLPVISPTQRWVITHVAENYKRNGFRIAVHAQNIEQAFDLLERVHPEVVKLNVESNLVDKDAWLFEDLLRQAELQNCLIVLRKIDSVQALGRLPSFLDSGYLFAIQGNAIDIARSDLTGTMLKSRSRTRRLDDADGQSQQCLC